MKLDRKTLDAIAKLPDDKLWQMLSLIASTTGIRLPREMPDGATMAGLRKAVGEMTDTDIGRAGELLASYKKGKGEGR